MLTENALTSKSRRIFLEKLTSKVGNFIRL